MSAARSLPEGFDIVQPQYGHAAGILRLRTAVWTEEARLAGISLDRINEHVAGWGSDQTVRDYGEYIEEIGADPAGHMRIARASGLVLGLIDADLYRTNQGDGIIRVLQVSRGARHMGIGTTLLSGYVQAAAGVTIDMPVIRENLPGRRFAYNRGFREVPGSFREEAGFIPTITMRKESGGTTA